MPAQVRLGRRPAVADPRVPFLYDLRAAHALAPPPPYANWYAAIGTWGALGNMDAGCCVEAAIGHATLLNTTYADDAAVPTDAETLALYSAITGYNPADPGSDGGTVILGPGGAMEHWAKTGVTFGGTTSTAAAYAKVPLGSDALWIRQAIHVFGSVLLGINLPASVVAGESIPFIWDWAGGPMAGGHCVLLCGYETIADETLFDAITWGQRVRLTLPFLRGTFEEAVAVYDPDSLNGRGLTGADFDATEMLAAMAAIVSAAGTDQEPAS